MRGGVRGESLHPSSDANHDVAVRSYFRMLGAQNFATCQADFVRMSTCSSRGKLQIICWSLPVSAVSCDVVDHLEEILDVFGADSAITLEAMTHAEAPWRQARGNVAPDMPSVAKINQDVMKKFYRSL